MTSLVLLCLLCAEAPKKSAADWDWERYLETRAKAAREQKSFVVVVGYFAFPRIDGITYVQVGSFPGVKGDGLVVARWAGKEHDRYDLPASATAEQIKSQLRNVKAENQSQVQPTMIWQGRSC